jgi:hypothetical protein
MKLKAFASQREFRWLQANHDNTDARTSIFWIMDAKKAETRARRLAELIDRSARGEPIKLLDRRPRR